MNKIDEILKMVKEYYSIEDNSAGGSLHCVLDDGNLTDSDVEWCINFAKENYDYKGVGLGVMLSCLSYEQREELYNKFWENN